jgi:hypothetical protein
METENREQRMSATDHVGMDSGVEYLVSFGRSGDFGRFRAPVSLSCRRGDRVVIRTEQGVELGIVLCPAEGGHARFLSRTAEGELLRHAGPEDELQATRLQTLGDAIFEHACALVVQLHLPLEVVDVDVLFDGKHALLYHLRREECDYRPLVSSVARAFDLHVVMQNLFVPTEAVHGCGEPDCGGGNCSSCGSGGGCSTCGKGAKAEEVGRYLATLHSSGGVAQRHPLL